VALDKEKKLTGQALRQAVPQLAEYTRDTIRKRIPPGASTSSGMSNRFPGYAATGGLKNAVVAGPLQVQGNVYRATVGIPATTSPAILTRAYVHEFGKVIHARRAPYLVFQVQGQWVKTKRVRIRAKRFFRAGWGEAKGYFPEALGRMVRSHWIGS
jgi:hypothetical protein